MLSKRGFLRLLGVSPWAAKKGLEDLKVSSFSTGNVLQEDATSGIRSGIPMDDSESIIKKLKRHYEYLVKNGVPKWVRMEHWTAAQKVYVLDPDLECLVSMSLSRKIQLQTQRNYERLNQGYIDSQLLAASRFEEEKIIEKLIDRNG